MYWKCERKRRSCPFYLSDTRLCSLMRMHKFVVNCNSDIFIHNSFYLYTELLLSDWLNGSRSIVCTKSQMYRKVISLLIIMYWITILVTDNNYYYGLSSFSYLRGKLRWSLSLTADLLLKWMLYEILLVLWYFCKKTQWALFYR